MSDILKYLWIGTATFCVLALIASIPVAKYQTTFKGFLYKQKYAPQARLNAAQKYMDAYERGEISDIYQFGYSPEFINYYHQELNTGFSPVKNGKDFPKYSRPLYLRDKNNPEILYPYSESLEASYYKR